MSDQVIFTINVNVKEAVKNTQKFRTEFGKAVVGIFPDLTKTQKLFKKFGEIATGAFSAAKKAAIDFAKALPKNIYEELKESVNVYRKFEDELIVVRRTAGLTADQMEILGDAVRNAGIHQLDGAINAEKLATALGIAGQQGWISKEMFDNNREATIKFAESFAKTMGMMEIATDMTLPKAAQQLGMIHNIFKGAPADIERLGSVINDLGNTMNVGQAIIAEATKRLSLYAANAGLSESSTATLAASMVNLGLTARQAGTSTGKVMQKMTTNYADFAEVFELNSTKFKKLVQTNIEGAFVMLGKRIGDLKAKGPEGIEQINVALKKLGLTGDGVSKAMLGLGSVYSDLTEKFEGERKVWEEKNSLLKETQIAASTLTKRLEGVWNRFSEIRMMIGGPLAKALSSFIKTDIYPLIDAFIEWIKQTKIIEEAWEPMLTAAKRFFIWVIAETKKFLQDQTRQMELWEQIKSVIKSIIAVGNDLWTVLTSKGTKAFLRDMWNILKGISKTIAGSIKNWYLVSEAIDKATRKVKNFIAAMKHGNPLDALSGGEGRVTVGGGEVKRKRKKGYGKIETEEYAYVYDAMSDSVVRGTQTVADLRKETKNLNQDLKTVEMTSHKKSVWPDMQKWIEANIASVGGLEAQLQKVGKWLDFYNDFRLPEMSTKMLAESNQWLSRQIQGLTNYQSGLQHQINLEAGKSQPVESRKISQGVLGQADQSVTIIFQGTNIVDERSQEAFARKIGGILQHQSTLLVSA